MGVFRTGMRVSQRFHGLKDTLICKCYKLESQGKASYTETIKLEKKKLHTLTLSALSAFFGVAQEPLVLFQWTQWTPQCTGGTSLTSLTGRFSVSYDSAMYQGTSSEIVDMQERNNFAPVQAATDK